MEPKLVVTLYTDPRLLDHKPHPGHPERPERVATVLRHLQRTGQLERCRRGNCRPATDEELLSVHSPGHLSRMHTLAAVGGGQAEADTWLSSGSDLAARIAAGSVIDAIADVMLGEDPQAFCLVRPPGHHALEDQPMGFCLYGSIAVGAANALKRHDLSRILIVDWDVHHGNGTQAMFYENEQVGFFSIHRHPFYPGSGEARETGRGAALGTNINVPIRYGTRRADYLAQFQNHLETMADRLKPELVLISAGFDAHEEDPVGDLGLREEDFATMTKLVQEIAANHARSRIVSVLEGGYNPSKLASCVSEHLTIMGIKTDTQE